MKFRELARGCVPPLLKSAVSRLVSSPTTYSGPYPDWSAATAAAGGYAEAQIIRQVEAATRRVLRGEACFEQDGIAFDTPAPVTPVLSGLLLAAALDSGHLQVVDFGGSLASHFLKWRRFFDALESVQWQVVEQPGFVEAGESVFANSRLPVSFHRSITELGDASPSVVLLGSVLQYLETPLDTLARLRDLGPKVLVIDRTPVAPDASASILVQHVSPRIYPGSYPMHVLGGNCVHDVLAGRYELVHGFGDEAAPVSAPGVAATFRGSIWLRRESDDR